MTNFRKLFLRVWIKDIGNTNLDRIQYWWLIWDPLHEVNYKKTKNVFQVTYKPEQKLNVVGLFLETISKQNK